MTATGAATFNTKDVLTANLVTVNSTTLADGTNGGLASNYSLGAGQTDAASITPIALTVSVAAPDKVYNGDTTAAPTLTITGGLVNTETVTTSATGTFNTKDVLTANLVTVNSSALADGTNGGLASNYTVGTGQTVAASITPYALTATVAAPNKVYNGNTTAAPTLTITGGFVNLETVSATAAGTFNTKDVATAKPVGHSVAFGILKYVKPGGTSATTNLADPTDPNNPARLVGQAGDPLVLLGDAF